MSTKGSILVVDDYWNWRDFLKYLLEEDGYTVDVASSYVDANNKLGFDAFDIVILDMRLVDAETYNVQGMALLRQIKTQTPKTGAIILTGYPDELHEKKAVTEYGADAYLSKVPKETGDFDIEAFLMLVKKLIKKNEN